MFCCSFFVERLKSPIDEELLVASSGMIPVEDGLGGGSQT